MRKILVGLTVLSLASAALAASQPDLDARIQLLTSKFTAMQERPDRRIPEDALRRAKGIVLLDQTKAGFIFAVQAGHGIAMARTENGGWSAPSFVSAGEGSFGFQGGGERDFLVILFMDDNSVRELTQPAAEFGGGARGTAGDNSSGVANQVTPERQRMLVYGDHSGFYAGAYVKGGSITPDIQANMVYYRQDVTPQEIMFGNKVGLTPPAARLVDEISNYSGHPAQQGREHPNKEKHDRTVAVPRSE